MATKAACMSWFVVGVTWLSCTETAAPAGESGIGKTCDERCAEVSATRSALLEACSVPPDAQALTCGPDNLAAIVCETACLEDAGCNVMVMDGPVYGYGGEFPTYYQCLRQCPPRG